MRIAAMARSVSGLMMMAMGAVLAQEDETREAPAKDATVIPPEAWEKPWVNLVPLDPLPKVMYTKDNPPVAPAVADLEQQDAVSQYGITWKFSRPVPVGKFVNGDYYVVGPVTVTEIIPGFKDGRNGSMLNYKPGKVSFDSRVKNDYDAKMNVALPVEMKPGDALVSTRSYAEENFKPVRRMLGPFNKGHLSVSAVEVGAVLTCLAEPAPPDAFRPAYMDPAAPLHLARNLRRELLPSLAKVKSVEPYQEDGEAAYFKVNPETKRAENIYDIRAYERFFRLPWLDTTFFSFTAPQQNMPQYGRELGKAISNATLLLCLDYTPQQKERLLINVCQVGIDRWGMLKAGYRGWPAYGGHGSGRKWSIVFAGIMLGDEDMMRPYRLFPKALFGEDMHTAYGQAWTGAKVLYTGHVGAEGKTGDKVRPGWGAYEHLQPAEWPKIGGDWKLGESYRRCCTSNCWVGQALAIRLLKAEQIWGHDAFLDYVDRWMTEDDAEHVAIIKRETGQDFDKTFLRGRKTWDPFVDEMYSAYRK